MRSSRSRGRRARTPLVGIAALAAAGVLGVAIPAGTADGHAAVRALRSLDRLDDRGAPAAAVVAPGTARVAGAHDAPALAEARGVSDLGSRSIVVGGVTRTYLISIPAGLHGPAPLVLLFHGLFGNAGALARQTGIVPATAAAHEILVLPQSLGAGFNDGRFGPSGPNDDAFAMAIMDRLEQRGLVDPERVTVAGISNGAGMAMQIADAHPDRIAAVVSIDGEMIRASLAPRPTGPVEAVLVHGTADAIQPWGGRPRLGPDEPAYISEMDTVRAWVRVDRSRALVRTTLPGAVGHGAAGPVIVDRWGAGPSGAGVTFYRVDGMHHRWPVSTYSPSRSNQLTAISGTAIVVQTAAEATREGRRTVIV